MFYSEHMYMYMYGTMYVYEGQTTIAANSSTADSRIEMYHTVTLTS